MKTKLNSSELSADADYTATCCRLSCPEKAESRDT